MKTFKITHRTKLGTRQLILHSAGLKDVLDLFYKKTGTGTTILEIYEKSDGGNWVDMDISGR